MTPEVTVGIPVLARPERVQAVADSLRASVLHARLHPLFIASPGDAEELSALERAGEDYLVAGWEPGPGDFARKHNHAIRRCSTEWYFIGADDLTFHRGWAELALATWIRTGACVIGTNDLGNRLTASGLHATHLLVHRDYLECGTVDEPGLLLHEGYDHTYVDNEFVETARARGTYAHAEDSIVEHLHPLWGKAQQDTTYQRGREGASADARLFQKRRPLWGGRAV